MSVLSPVVDRGMTLGFAYVPHPLAEVFTMMTASELAGLTQDIREHGLREPIVLLDGQVLDGRNRYLAAREAGVSLVTADYIGDDPLAYVLSLNLHRRHLDAGQRAMVGAKVAKLPRGSNQHTAIAAPSQAEAGAMLKVSADSIQRAAFVQEHATPELIANVEAGEVSVSAAALVATLPEIEQAAVVSEGPAAVRETAKQLRFERAPQNYDLKSPLKALRNKPLAEPAPVVVDEPSAVDVPGLLFGLVDVFADLPDDPEAAAEALPLAAALSLDASMVKGWADWLTRFHARLEARFGN